MAQSAAHNWWHQTCNTFQLDRPKKECGSMVEGLPRAPWRTGRPSGLSCLCVWPAAGACLPPHHQPRSQRDRWAHKVSLAVQRGRELTVWSWQGPRSIVIQSRDDWGLGTGEHHTNLATVNCLDCPQLAHWPGLATQAEPGQQQHAHAHTAIP